MTEHGGDTTEPLFLKINVWTSTQRKQNENAQISRSVVGNLFFFLTTEGQINILGFVSHVVCLDSRLQKLLNFAIDS